MLEAYRLLLQEEGGILNEVNLATMMQRIALVSSEVKADTSGVIREYKDVLENILTLVKLHCLL